MFDVSIDIDLTIINDRDQRVVASRRFSQVNQVSTDQAGEIVKGFQTVLDKILPTMSDWVIKRV